MSFKQGDRVAVVESLYGDIPTGATGTVLSVVAEDPRRLFVALDDHPDPLAGFGFPEGWALMDSEVEHV